MGIGDDTYFVENTNNSPSEQSQMVRRRLAEAMLKQGIDSSPVGSKYQAWARVLNSLGGDFKLQDLENREKKSKQEEIDFRNGKPPSSSGSYQSDPISAAPSPAGPVSTEGLNMSEPRSVRTNNVGALNDGPFARSQPGYVGSDGRLAKYDTQENGYKATEALLRSKGYMGGGNNTVAGIIGRWAPADVDNNSTPAYIAIVSKKLGVDPNQPLSNDQVGALAEHIAAYEAGKPVPRQTAQAATPAPVQVADASGGIPASAVPPIAAPVPDASAQPPAAVQPPVATPTPAPQAAAPGVPRPAPLTRDQIEAQAIKDLGARGRLVELGRRSLNDKVRAAAEDEFQKAVKRVESVQGPVDPKGIAEMEYKLSQTRENDAQIEGHRAKSREATANARSAEIANTKVRTRDQIASGITGGLQQAIDHINEYGRENVERATGRMSGDDHKQAQGGDNWLQTALSVGPGAARLAGDVKYTLAGGVSPETVRQTLDGDMLAVAAQVKDFVRGKGEGVWTDADQELLNKITGKVTKAATMEEALRAVHDGRERIKQNWKMDIGELKGARPPVEQAKTAAEGLDDKFAAPAREALRGPYAQQGGPATLNPDVVKELQERFKTPGALEAFWNAIRGGQ